MVGLAGACLTLFARALDTGRNPMSAATDARRLHWHDQATGLTCGWPLTSTAPMAIDVPELRVITVRT